MRKNYIIKDVRKTLAQQINNIDTSERTSMENTHFSSTGLSAVIPKDNDGYCITAFAVKMGNAWRTVVQRFS